MSKQKDLWWPRKERTCIRKELNIKCPKKEVIQEKSKMEEEEEDDEKEYFRDQGGQFAKMLRRKGKMRPMGLIKQHLSLHPLLLYSSTTTIIIAFFISSLFASANARHGRNLHGLLLALEEVGGALALALE